MASTASAFALIFIAVACSSMYSSSGAAISGDLASTLRITAKLCLCSNRDSSVAAKFFACYDVAPGKDLFVKCQNEVYGYVLNTQENIRKTCRNLAAFPKYSACLQREFAAAGIDLQATLDKVNKCEAGVVGIN